MREGLSLSLSTNIYSDKIATDEYYSYQMHVYYSPVSVYYKYIYICIFIHLYVDCKIYIFGVGYYRVVGPA